MGHSRGPQLTVSEQDTLVKICHQASVEGLREDGFPTVWWAEAMGGQRFYNRVRQLISELDYRLFDTLSRARMAVRFHLDYEDSTGLPGIDDHVEYDDADEWHGIPIKNWGDRP